MINVMHCTSWLLCLFCLANVSLSSVPVVDNESKLIRECPSYGCPKYPRDVFMDDNARSALTHLVSSSKSKENLDRALSELESCGDRNTATMTMIGYKGGYLSDQINQDRAFVLSPFRVNIPAIKDARILGVFDGHSNEGEIVAEFAVQQLPRRLALKLEIALTESVIKDPKAMDETVKRALVETFVEIDKDIPTQGVGGCTATVVLQLGSKLYFANAGDSQSFLVTHNSKSRRVQIVFNTREDKPDLLEERARIEQMGGTVRIPSAEDDDTARAIRLDPETGNWYGLAMSRSIGDWDVPGVIAEPIVNVLHIEDLVKGLLGTTTCQATEDGESEGSETCTEATPLDGINLFAVSATDGMMDYLSREDIAASFADAFYGDDGVHPLTACKDLIVNAANGWNNEFEGSYRDDIAVAACKITLDTVP